MRFSAGSTAVFIRWSSTSAMNCCDIRIPEGVRIRIRLFGHYGQVLGITRQNLHEQFWVLVPYSVSRSRACDNSSRILPCTPQTQRFQNKGLSEIRLLHVMKTGFISDNPRFRDEAPPGP